MKKNFKRALAFLLTFAMVISCLIVNFSIATSADATEQPVLLYDFESGIGDVAVQTGAWGAVAHETRGLYAKSGNSLQVKVNRDGQETNSKVQNIYIPYTHTAGYNGLSFWMQNTQGNPDFDIYVENLETNQKVLLLSVSIPVGTTKEITALYPDEFVPSQTASKNRIVLSAILASSCNSYSYVDEVYEIKGDPDQAVEVAKTIADFEPSGDISAVKKSGSCAPTLSAVADPRDANGHALKVDIPVAANANAVHSYTYFEYAYSSEYEGVSFWIKAETALNFEVRLERGLMGEYALCRVSLAAGESQNIMALYADIRQASSLNATIGSKVSWPPYDVTNQTLKVKIYALGSTTTAKSFIIDDIKQNTVENFNNSINQGGGSDTVDGPSKIINDFETGLTTSACLATTVGWPIRGSGTLSTAYAKSGTQSVKIVGSADSAQGVQQLGVKFVHTAGMNGISFWVKAETAVTFDVRVRNQGDDQSRVTIQRVSLKAGEEREIIAFYEDAKDSVGLGTSLSSAAPKAFDPAKNANKQIEVFLFFQCAKTTEKVFYVDDIAEVNKAAMGFGPTGEAVFPATPNEVIADFEGATHPAYLEEGYKFTIETTEEPVHEGQKALGIKVGEGIGLTQNRLRIPYLQMADKDGISFWFHAKTDVKFTVSVLSGEDTYTLLSETARKGFDGVIKVYYKDAKPAGFAPAVGDKLEFVLTFNPSQSANMEFYVDAVKQYKKGTNEGDITGAYEHTDDIKYYKETLNGDMIQDFENAADLTFVTLKDAVVGRSGITANTTVFNTGAQSIKVISDQGSGSGGVLSFTYNKAAKWNSFSFWMAAGQTVVLDIKATLGDGSPQRLVKKTVQGEYSGFVTVPFLEDSADYAGEVKIDITVTSTLRIAVVWIDSIMQTNHARPTVTDTEKKGNTKDDAEALDGWNSSSDFEAYADNAALFEEWDFVAESDWLTGSFVLDRGNQYRGYNSLRMDYDFSYTENPAKQSFSIQGPLQNVDMNGLSFYLRADSAVIVDVSIVDGEGRHSILRLPAKEYDEMVSVDFTDIVGGNSNFGRINKDALSVRLTLSPATNTLQGTVYVDDISYSATASSGGNGGSAIPETGVKEPLFLYIPAILCAAVMVVVSWKRQLVK